MKKDEFLHTRDDKEAKSKLRKHMKQPGICKQLKAIWEGTLLRLKKQDMLSLSEVKKLLEKAKFKCY
jgi:hypothetical protein